MLAKPSRIFSVPRGEIEIYWAAVFVVVVVHSPLSMCTNCMCMVGGWLPEIYRQRVLFSCALSILLFIIIIIICVWFSSLIPSTAAFCGGTTKKWTNATRNGTFCNHISFSHPLHSWTRTHTLTHHVQRRSSCVCIHVCMRLFITINAIRKQQNNERYSIHRA